MVSELFSTCLTTEAAKSSSWASEELLVWLPESGRRSSFGLPSDGAISELRTPGAFSDLILGEEGVEGEGQEEVGPVKTSRKQELFCTFYFHRKYRTITEP